VSTIINNPFLVFLISLVAQWGAAYLGDLLRRRVRPLGTEERDDFNTVLTATLTLLVLIIGFSFSMAVSRYDQRKNYEEAEANAIGTAFVRADLLPPPEATKVRELLGRYLELRIAFYLGGERRSAEAATEAAKLQSELWSSVAQAAAVQPTPPAALVVSGMNDVLNAQGYTQAAWWNRIPAAAWGLMLLIAILSNMLLGYREQRTGMLVLLILPMIISIALFLIADIDSPYSGIIHVSPQNLISLSESIRAHPH
jgi:hypothetical protein